MLRPCRCGFRGNESGGSAAGTDGGSLVTAPPDTLQAVIESFVLREGTEYGMHEVPLASKVSQVRKQLERGEAQIMFDPATESVDIRTIP
jgi:uncharacterized protein YheU (UPF0270 family)